MGGVTDQDPHGAAEWPPRPPALPGLDELPEVPPFLPGTPIGGHQADDYAPPPRYQTPSSAPGSSPLRLEGELIKWPNDTESAVPATPAADELWSPDVFGEDSGTVELAGAVVQPMRARAASTRVAPTAAPPAAPAAPPATAPTLTPSPATTAARAPVLEPVLAAVAAPSLPASAAPTPTVTPALPTAPSSPPVVTAAVATAPAPSLKPDKRKKRRKQEAVQPPARVIPLSPPDVSEANRASIEMLRRQAVKTRKRNQRVARTIFAVFALMVLAAGAGIVWLFLQGDKDDTSTTEAAAVAAADTFDDNDAAAAAGGGLIPNADAVGAIGAAQDAVDAVNGTDSEVSPASAGSLSLADVSADQLVPALFVPLGESLGVSAEGLTRYVFDGPTLAAVDGQAFAEWLALVGALPQSGNAVASLTAGALPGLATGDIGVAIATDGKTVTRFIAVSADASLTADA